MVESIKITRRVTTKIQSGPHAGQTILQEEKELEAGKYHEYYLPALIGMGPSSEMRIIIEVDGVETQLHLKR